MKAELIKDLERLFGWLHLNGAALPRDVEEDISRRCPGSGWAKITKEPVVHFAVELGRHWVNRSPGNAVLAGLAAWLILRLHRQTTYYKGSPGRARAYDHLSLVVRRIWLLAIISPAILHPERIEAFLRRNSIQLPDATLAVEFPIMKQASEQRLRNFLHWFRRLQEDLPPLAQRDDSDLSDDDGISSRAYLAGDEIRLKQGLAPRFQSEQGLYKDKIARRLQGDFAMARMQAAATCLEPVALSWLRDLMQIEDFSALDSATLRHHLVWLLELYNGIPSRDGFNLGLQKGSSPLGYLTASGITLRVNSGYYPSAGCWEQDDLSLPLPSVTVKILAELSRRFPHARKISDFRQRDEKLMDKHRVICNQIIKKYLPGWNGLSIRIDRVFLRTAFLACDLCAALVGLLRVHPLGGARGESAYLSRPHRTIIRAFNRIHRSIHDQAGLPFEDYPFGSPDPNRLYGKRAMSMADYCALTLRHIQEASTENELIACAIRVLRGIGYRRRNAQLNPWLLLRDDIMPLLEIQDKLAGNWFPPRFVPLTPAYLRLVKEIGRIFGVSETLTYHHEGRECALEDLPVHVRDRLRFIIEHTAQHNPGRTALFNALLARDCGQVVRQVLLGHGSHSTHLYGNQLVVPPCRVLQSAADLLFSICQDEGLDGCATALTERLKTISKRTTASDSQVHAIPSERPPAWAAKIPSNMHEPLSYAENCLKDAMYRKFRGSGFPGDHATAKYSHRPAQGWPLNETGLVAAAALELNLPLEALLQYQAYYTYKNLLYDCHSEKIYLNLVMEHHDDGGLSKIPVFVCTFAEEKQNRFMKLVRYRFDRAVARIWQKRKFAANQYAAEQSRPASRLPQGRTEVEVHDEKIEQIKAEVLNHRLFGAEDIHKPAVDLELGFLIKGGEGRASGGAYRLLNRVSKCRCSLWYPPLLAGVLCSRSELGLNHFSIQDQFNVRNRAPTELKDLTGRMWLEVEPEAPAKLPTRAAQTRLFNQMKALNIMGWRLIFQADTRLITGREFEREPSLDEGQLTAGLTHEQYTKLRLKIRGLGLGDWKQLAKRRTGRKQGTFAGGLTDMLGEMGLSLRQAQGLSRRIKNHLRREGKLTCSSALPLVTRAELSRIIEKTSSSIDSFKARNRRNREGNGAEIGELQAEMVLELNLLQHLMLRPKEPWGLYTEDLIRVADVTYIFIARGKTEHARRTLHLPTKSLPTTRSLLEQVANPVSVGPRLLTCLRSHHPKSHHSVSASLTKRLSEAAGKNLRPYDLRHLGIIHALQDEVLERLINGNLGNAVANLSVQVGHGAPTITLSTYVGTALFQFM